MRKLREQDDILAEITGFRMKLQEAGGAELEHLQYRLREGPTLKQDGLPNM